MIEKKVRYFAVTIKCLVRDKDINGNPVTKSVIREKMDLEFDQLEWDDVKLVVE